MKTDTEATVDELQKQVAHLAAAIQILSKQVQSITKEIRR